MKIDHEELRDALRPEDHAWLEYGAIRSGLPSHAWTADSALVLRAKVWVSLDLAARLEGQVIDEHKSPTRRYTWASAVDAAEACFFTERPNHRTKNVRRFLAALLRRVTQ
ncbi:MAG: hypothetical protein ACREMZ_11210 [Gemmatimonadales bacterium]